ncbi:MAG TPA: hypothetical protein PLV83_06280 [Bacilli bacterium]|nr:hypothetical protein [Bacilli bacterium]
MRVKKEFKFKNETIIEAEYDSDEYNVLFNESEGRIILIRLSDNVVLKTFTNISFIIQTKINEINHFMVADYNKNLNDRSKSDELIHYIDYGNPTLNEHKRLDIKSSCLCSTRIMDNVYLTSFCDKEQLYNLKKESKRYDKIFWKNGLMDRFDEKTVLVNEKLGNMILMIY